MISVRKVVGLASFVVVSAIASISVQAQNTAAAWGSNGSGQLGNGASGTNSSVVVPVSGLTGVIAVNGGVDHSFAIKNDGTLWAWGQNWYGQLGIGSTTNSPVPVQVTGISSVAGVSGGLRHSLAFKSDGTLWSWGSNISGELGTGVPGGSTTPQQVTALSNVVGVGAGHLHSIALRNDGTVWAFGNGSYGQLGSGITIQQQNTPVQVSGLTDVVAVAAGAGHNLALKSDGTVWAWGYGYWGQLGNGSTSDSNIPVQVPGLTGVIAVAAGGDHSLALKSDGTVWAWGYNNSGQVGDGTTSAVVSSPVQSSITGVAAISAGGHHSMALKPDGTVWVWGANNQGQLGHDSSIESPLPAPVAGLSGVAGIAGGGFHSLAYGNISYVTPTSVQVSAASAQIGKSTTFIATLRIQTAGAGLPGKSVQFAIDGNNVGAPVITDSAGKAKLNYVVPAGTALGSHTLSATFAGDANYFSATGSNTLTVAKGPVKVFVYAASGPPGGNATLSAKLTNGSSQPISGATLDFTVNGNPAGSATTDATGKAMLVYAIPAGTALGNYPYSASFAGNGSYLSGSGSGTLSVVPPKLLSLSITPTTVIGGTSATGKVTLDGVAPSDTTVTLTSGNSAAHPPASVVVLAGSKEASFTINTDPVTSKTMGAVSATLNSVTKSVSMTVNPPTYKSFTIAPNPVKGGLNTTGTVTMSGPVALDTTVNLTNANPKAHLPGATVTIPAGSASVSFTITTDPTATTVSGAVTANVGSVTKSVTLKVSP